MTRIKDLPAHERPREKFIAGADVSTAELLAILLHTGVKGDNSISLASRLLARFGGLRGLFSAPLQALQSVAGVGSAKAVRLACVSALGQRYLAERVNSNPSIDSADDLMRLLIHKLRDQRRECLKVITLNGSNEVISISDQGIGTVEEIHLYPREIVKRALDDDAAAVILVHNHPAGSPAPSAADRRLTRRLAALLRPFGIRLHDHIIIGRNDVFSIRGGIRADT
jgi:DNA repair protein RadC